MPIVSLPALAPMLEKLERWAPLTEADRAAILALPHRIRTLSSHDFIVREGNHSDHSCILLSGFAVRHKITGRGGRQIMSLHMVGDLVDLQNSLLTVADHNVQAVSPVVAAFVPVGAIKAIATNHVAVGRAMWRETLIEASIFREAIINIGRRDAESRVAHFLCEIALRMEAAGLGTADRFVLPLTQEQLGDMLGLTSVHINRTLRQLGEQKIIERAQRSVVVRDFRALRSIGDFDSTYLHLHGSTPDSMSGPGVYG